MPIIVFIRMMYATVVVFKLDVFGAVSDDETYLSKAGSAMELFGQVTSKVTFVADSSRFRVAAVFQGVLQRLLKTCVEKFSCTVVESNSVPIEPLLNLSLEEEFEPTEPNLSTYTGTHLGSFETEATNLQDYEPATCDVGFETTEYDTSWLDQFLAGN